MPHPTATPHVLIVDDEEAVCWALERGLTRDGYSVATSASAEDAFRVKPGRALTRFAGLDRGRDA